MMSFCDATFAGHREFGNFVDAGAVAAGIGAFGLVVVRVVQIALQR